MGVAKGMECHTGLGIPYWCRGVLCRWEERDGRASILWLPFLKHCLSIIGWSRCRRSTARYRYLLTARIWASGCHLWGVKLQLMPLTNYLGVANIPHAHRVDERTRSVYHSPDQYCVCLIVALLQAPYSCLDWVAGREAPEFRSRHVPKTVRISSHKWPLKSVCPQLHHLVSKVAWLNCIEWEAVCKPQPLKPRVHFHNKNIRRTEFESREGLQYGSTSLDGKRGNGCRGSVWLDFEPFPSKV